MTVDFSNIVHMITLNLKENIFEPFLPRTLLSRSLENKQNKFEYLFISLKTIFINKYISLHVCAHRRDG